MGAELEEKIRDLETTISNQSQAMQEMGRRVEIYKKEADTSRKWNSSLSLNLGKANLDATKDVTTPVDDPEISFIQADTTVLPALEAEIKSTTEGASSISSAGEDQDRKVEDDSNSIKPE